MTAKYNCVLLAPTLGKKLLFVRVKVQGKQIQKKKKQFSCCSKSCTVCSEIKLKI